MNAYKAVKSSLEMGPTFGDNVADEANIGDDSDVAVLDNWSMDRKRLYLGLVGFLIAVGLVVLCYEHIFKEGFTFTDSQSMNGLYAFLRI